MTIKSWKESPIDLIPDFIPILGYIDDLILIPLGIYLVLKLIPKEILDEYREKLRTVPNYDKPKNWIAGGIVVLVWLFVICLIRSYGFSGEVTIESIRYAGGDACL